MQEQKHELIDPEKMTDAQLYEHIEKTCPKYPCEKGCPVIDGTVTQCCHYPAFLTANNKIKSGILFV